MGQRKLPHWHSVTPSTARHVHPKRRLRYPGRYRKAHQADLRLLSAVDDTAVGFAKGPGPAVDLAARKRPSPSPDPWEVIEVTAQRAAASSNTGYGYLNVDGATTTGAEAAVERAAGALDRPFPHRCLQRECKGEGDRR